MGPPRGEVLQGTLDLIVLQTLHAMGPLHGFFRKRHLDGDLDAVLRAHLEMLAEENIRRGMGPAEARYAARREFGGLEQSKELHREQRSLPFLDALLQD